MCAWIIPPVGLIEPAVAPEIYIDGIGAIEMLSGSLRIYLIAEQLPLEAGNGPPQKIIVAKVIRPLIGVPSAIGQLAQCLTCERSPGIFPRPDRTPRVVR